jgi:hypothetical protein
MSRIVIVILIYHRHKPVDLIHEPSTSPRLLLHPRDGGNTSFRNDDTTQRASKTVRRIKKIYRHTDRQTESWFGLGGYQVLKNAKFNRNS